MSNQRPQGKRAILERGCVDTIFLTRTAMIFSLLFLLNSCQTQSSFAPKTQQKLFLAPFSIPCPVQDTTRCLVVTDGLSTPGSEGSWVLFDTVSSIQGLNFQEGYFYKIYLEPRVIGSPIQSQGAARYQMVREEEKLSAKSILGEWKIVTFKGAGDLPSDVQPTLTLGNFSQKEVEQMSGQFINRFFSPILLTSETLSFGEIASTRMGGPGIEEEGKLLGNLALVERFTQKNQQLILQSKRGEKLVWLKR